MRYGLLFEQAQHWRKVLGESIRNLRNLGATDYNHKPIEIQAQIDENYANSIQAQRKLREINLRMELFLSIKLSQASLEPCRANGSVWVRGRLSPTNGHQPVQSLS